MDIQRSLDSIRSELPDEWKEQAADHFLSGYRSARPVDGEALDIKPVCMRYADLYGYARVLRATHERWENELGWMRNLRGHLQRLMEERGKLLGKEIRL